MGCALLIATIAAVWVLCCRRHAEPLPATSIPEPSAEVRVKAVDWKGPGVDAASNVIVASDAVAIICGEDDETADRYEARNDALRSIARRRNLSKNDVAALMAYLSDTNDSLRVERVAALKNDVMNLLRIQSLPPEDFAETLVAMFALLGVLVLLGTKIFGPLK